MIGLQLLLMRVFHGICVAVDKKYFVRTCLFPRQDSIAIVMDLLWKK